MQSPRLVASRFLQQQSNSINRSGVIVCQQRHFSSFTLRRLEEQQTGDNKTGNEDEKKRKQQEENKAKPIVNEVKEQKGTRTSGTSKKQGFLKGASAAVKLPKTNIIKAAKRSPLLGAGKDMWVAERGVLDAVRSHDPSRSFYAFSDQDSQGREMNRELDAYDVRGNGRYDKM